MNEQTELLEKFSLFAGIKDYKNVISNFLNNEEVRIKNKIVEKNSKIVEKNNILIEDEDSEHEIIKIFTDGSVINNGKRNAKGGYGVYIKNGESLSLVYDEKFEEGPATNQKTELLAIHSAINLLKKRKEKIFVIYSDSLYSINCLTKWCVKWEKNNWVNSTGEEVKNKQLLKDILNNLRSCTDKKITFVHMNSHRREPFDKNSEEWELWNGNENADKLAKQAMKSACSKQFN